MAVTFDGTRLNTAEAITNWTGNNNIAVEPDFKYQGTYSISSIVKTTEAGIYYTNGTGVNMSNTPNKFWLAKFILTNKDVLDGNGMTMVIGSSSGNYYYYYVYNTTTKIYPIAGGFQLIPLDPNIALYRSGTTGTPNLASVTYFGIRADLSSTAKSQNLGVDAMDVIPVGSGLTWTGTDGNFTEFVTFDEGVSNNRYGVVSTREGIMYINGTLTIGNTGSTTFTGTTKTIVFPTGLFGTNCQGIRVGLLNTNNSINFIDNTFIGRGVAATNDTRPNFTVGGLSGTCFLDGNTFTNFNATILNSKVTLINSSFVTSGLVSQYGAVITNTTFDSSTSTSSVLCNNPSGISYCTFISDNTNHGIEFTTGGTYYFSGNTFENYATTSGSSGNEAIYNNSGTLLTLIITNNGSNPSYRNGVGATTNIIYGLTTLTFSGLIADTEVRIYKASDMTEIAGTESSTTSFSYQYVYTENIPVIVRIFNLQYVAISLNLILTNNSNTIPIQQQYDRNYENL
jgi:hypothetical protein